MTTAFESVCALSHSPASASEFSVFAEELTSTLARAIANWPASPNSIGATTSATPPRRTTNGASAPPSVASRTGVRRAHSHGALRPHNIHAATSPNVSQIINDAVACTPAPVGPRRVHDQAAMASGVATRSKIVANARGLFRANATTVWIPYQRYRQASGAT